MKILAKYIHDSADSTDVDVHYVVDELPCLSECKEFCNTNKDIENRNLIVINDGVVTACYKGSIDEVNNGLIDTYNLHNQEYPLLVTKRITRNNYIKYIRGIRGILSHISRSQYRPIVKPALVSNSWTQRLNVFHDINFYRY